MYILRAQLDFVLKNAISILFWPIHFFGNFRLSNLDDDHDSYDPLLMFITMALIENHHHLQD